MRGSRVRGWGRDGKESYFYFETLPPARRLATSLDRGRRGLCCCPQRRAWACSRRFVGKSNFTSGKSQRLLRRSRHVVRVLHRVTSVDCNNSLENAGFPQQNFATLRMTYSRFAFYMATHTAANYSFSTREKNVMCCNARRGATQFARI